MNLGRSGAAKKQRALIVEPNRRQADAAAAVLSDCGYVASVARSPREALMVLSKPPKLVLIDAAGPLDPTVELLQAFGRMKALRGVPVVGTHGRTPPGDYERSQLRQYGMLAFLRLPLEPSALKKALDGTGGDSLPPLLPDAGPARPRMISPRAALQAQPASHRATDPQIAAIGGSGASAGLEFAGIEAPCVVISATEKQLIVRTPGPFPPRDGAIRVFITFRDVVQDSMKDMPVRILGRVTDIEARGAQRRARIEVRVATPDANLQRLVRYLGRLR